MAVVAVPDHAAPGVVANKAEHRFFQDSDSDAEAEVSFESRNMVLVILTCSSLPRYLNGLSVAFTVTTPFKFKSNEN